MVSDLFKSAANGLVRVVGDGTNRWPLVYDRDLADLYARIAARDDASGIFHANDEADERLIDIVSAIGAYLPVRPTCVMWGSRKPDRRWARTRTRGRSIRR
jgi:nucleoside-diphosphate-sugar epimerase